MFKLETTPTTTSVTTSSTAATEAKTTASENVSVGTSVKEPVVSEAPKSQHEVELKGTCKCFNQVHCNMCM